MAYSVTISSKGQLVIPAELRTRLGLKKGTRAVCSEENGRLIVTPIERVLVSPIANDSAGASEKKSSGSVPLVFPPLRTRRQCADGLL